MPTKFTGGSSPEGEYADKMFTLAHGFAGTGKTGFGLSHPGPFWVANFDRPIGNLTKQLPADAWHEITYEAFTVDVDALTRAAAAQYLTRFDALMKDALAHQAQRGTVIIDGFDLLWDTVKIAKIANLESDLPKEYAIANAYMNNWLTRLGKCGHNVLMTTISGKVWSGAKTETERVKAEGYKHKDRFLTHEIYLFSPDDRRTPSMVPVGGNPATPGATGQTHQAMFTMSKLNEKLINRVVPNLTFGLMYRLTFGENYPHPERLWSPAKAAAGATASEEAGASS